MKVDWSIGEYYRRNRDCLGPGKWHAHPEDLPESQVSTCEMETVLFLQSLVVLLRPLMVVELGTNAGIAAEAMAEALLPDARLLTVEANEELAEKARDRLKQFQNVSLVVADARYPHRLFPNGHVPGYSPVDLLFVDTGNSRLLELQEWNSFMSVFGVIVVHDTDTERVIRQEVEKFARDFAWTFLHLPTPRGLTLLRRQGR